MLHRNFSSAMSARPLFSVPPLLRTSVLLLVTLLGLAACRDEPASAALARPSTDYFPLGVGARTVRMQLAVLEPEMAVGLMYRTTLGTDDGMLFAYTSPRQMQFWMRNTLIPLDIGFFDAQGVLLEKHPMQPHDERGVISRHQELQYALEMNQGWFDRNGVKPGDKLDLRKLKVALGARGFEARRFGLE